MLAVQAEPRRTSRFGARPPETPTGRIAERRPLTERQRQLVADHVPLARKLARQEWRGVTGIERDDVLSAALEGLVLAADKYRPDRGVTFGAYAGCWILNRIYLAYRRETHVIKMPEKSREYRLEVFGLDALDDETAAHLPAEAPEYHVGDWRYSGDAVRELLAGCESDDQREVLWLVVVRGLPREVAAHVLGVSRPKLTKLLASALAALRAGLTGEVRG